jgi:hypothetical protein
MKQIPKLTTVNASVDKDIGVMFLSCPSCSPSLIAIPLREVVDLQSINLLAATLVSSAHEEIHFGHIRRIVMSDPVLQCFFFQATGRSLYIIRQHHLDNTFSNDGHILLCATASLHKVTVSSCVLLTFFSLFFFVTVAFLVQSSAAVLSNGAVPA